MVSSIIIATDGFSPKGIPKALLRMGEKTVLQNIVDVLVSARVVDIVVVLGNDAEKIKKEIEWFRGKVVVDESWSTGCNSSVFAGLRALENENVHGVFLWPVERPCVTQSTLVGMLQRFWIEHRQIVVPTFKGKRGYPLLISHALFTELEQISTGTGEEALLSSHREDVSEYPTTDDGVLRSIDTAEDYEEKKSKRALTNSFSNQP
jgi:molybdenum cofactor cytidylyltransferase